MGNLAHFSRRDRSLKRPHLHTLLIGREIRMRSHILVVDDDDRLRALLQRYLSGQDFAVSAASHAAEACELLKEIAFDLIVLDVMMPVESGFDLTKRLRGVTMEDDPLFPARKIPILLLTARGEMEDRITGLECGADDYLTKPFEPRELLLRIQAILRRIPKVSPQETTLILGRWRYEASRDELKSSTETIRLTGMEAGLMRLLAKEAGKPVSREVLAESGKDMVNDRTIDVQVTRLRRKIEDDAKNPRYLVTVRGEGYMLLPDSQE